LPFKMKSAEFEPVDLGFQPNGLRHDRLPSPLAFWIIQERARASSPRAASLKTNWEGLSFQRFFGSLKKTKCLKRMSSVFLALLLS